MPYDAEGNFIYPVPARKGKLKAPSRQPSVRPIPTRPPNSQPAPVPVAIPKPPVSIVAPIVPEPQPLAPPPTAPVPDQLVLPMPDGVAVFTIQEGGNRWQMSEQDLAQLWNAQTWPAALKLATSDGQAVEVVYRGRWSGGFGPDFKGAIVRVGAELLKGDIELHLRSADWKIHGHHQDQKYNQVVLQVTLEDSGAPSRTQAGTEMPVLALLPLFQQAGLKLADSLAKAKSSGTRLGSLSESEGPCCDRVAERTTDLGALLAQIDRLGDQRFDEKAARFEAACAADPDVSEAGAAQELWLGLLEALGYSQNKAPFRQLGATLPLSQVVALDSEARRRGESGDERIVTLEAALLGAAGLLPSQRRLRPTVRRVAETSAHFEPDGRAEPLEDFAAGRYSDELESRWNWLQRHLTTTSPTEWKPLKERDWTFARLRPPNHPSRRIAGLARLVVRLGLSEAEDLLAGLTARAEEKPAEACTSLAQFCRVELKAEENDSAAFWARRYDFSDRAILAGENAKGATADLIGTDRAADMVVNIILPFLVGYGRDRHSSRLVEAALATYRAHPRLGTNELVENVARQVFRYWLENPAEAEPYLGANSGRAGKISVARLIDGARRQQGLIHLHHHFCADQNFTNCPLA